MVRLRLRLGAPAQLFCQPSLLPQGDSSPLKSEAELVPLFSDPGCHPEASVHLHKPRCQGPSCSGDIFLKSSCDQVYHPITCWNGADVNSNTTSPEQTSCVMSRGPPSVKPRQGPRRDKHKGPGSGSCSNHLLLHPTEPEKDGCLCHLFNRPTCFHQEENSARGRTLHIYY